MLRNVAAIVGTQIHPFELGVVCEVFGIDRSDEGLPSFDFAVCAADPQPRRVTGGMTIEPGYDLQRTHSADLVAIPAWQPAGEPFEAEVIEALHAAVDRGATILAVCSGAFLLAAAGLLDGRRATCHWRHAPELQACYPNLTVDSDQLYVQDGQVVTSAGTSAGIDACLHLVRRELGAWVANRIARRMVVPPHRDGGQAQYVDTPVPRVPDEGAELAALLEWIQANLQRSHTVEALASRVHMAPRTFARRFTATTGTTPYQWITRQRVLLAQRLLEHESLDVEHIAHRTGFGTPEALRHHFSRQLGTTPSAYRQKFSHQLSPT